MYPEVIATPPSPIAALVGTLLGCELGWEHRSCGLVCTDGDLPALAQGRWEEEGRPLAGVDSDYEAFEAAFIAAYRGE